MAGTVLLECVEVVPESDGTVGVIIPSNCLWDCVECFGENRLSASFSYSSPYFVARMRAVTPERVQQTLLNWKPPMKKSA